MKVAIIGCGQIADAHINEARRIDGVKVVAVCDANRHMADQLAVRKAIPHAYTDVARMLEEVRADVVHITTPPGSHLKLGKMALEHGAHAYVEKPFTVNSAEAEELAAAAIKTEKLVCVGHNNAFDPAFIRLKDAVASGKIGNPVHVDAQMGYNLSGSFGALFMSDPRHWVHALPGGNAQNNISHPLSLILSFIPDMKPEVIAKGVRPQKQRFGDVRDKLIEELRVMIIGKHTTGSLIFTSRARPVQLNVTVIGTQGQASVSIDGRTMRLTFGSSMPGPFAKVEWAYRDMVEACKQLASHTADLLCSRLHFFEGMHELIRRFYLAIEGRGPMPIPVSEAVRTTSIMDAIFRATEEEECQIPV